MKGISKIFVSYFESSNFLDHSLPKEWQKKFHKAFVDLGDVLASLSGTLCINSHNYEDAMFLSYFDIVRIWCEVHDLLHHYLPDLFTVKLNFPIDESQITELKKVLKRLENSENCLKSLVS